MQMSAVNGRHVTVSGMTSFWNEAKEKWKLVFIIQNVMLLGARTSQRAPFEMQRNGFLT